MKRYSAEQLKKMGYVYEESVNDWIEWHEGHVEERDGGYAYGYVLGNSITGKEYTASCGFNWEGDWVVDTDTIEDIEES